MWSIIVALIVVLVLILLLTNTREYYGKRPNLPVKQDLIPVTTYTEPNYKGTVTSYPLGKYVNVQPNYQSIKINPGYQLKITIGNIYFYQRTSIPQIKNLQTYTFEVQPLDNSPGAFDKKDYSTTAVDGDLVVLGSLNGVIIRSVDYAGSDRINTVRSKCNNTKNCAIVALPTEFEAKYITDSNPYIQGSLGSGDPKPNVQKTVKISWTGAQIDSTLNNISIIKPLSFRPRAQPTPIITPPKQIQPPIAMATSPKEFMQNFDI